MPRFTLVPMSAEDVATVRRMFDAWNDGNVDRMTDFWAEDGDWIWQDPPGIPDGGVFRGREAVEGRLREVVGLLGGMSIDVLEVFDAGDAVVAAARGSVDGARSGIHLDVNWFHAIKLDRGRVRWYGVFFDRDAAMAAAGGAEP